MFDDTIKKKLDEHESAVPPGAWDNIVQKKKRRFTIWWWGAMILLWGGLCTGGYFFIKEGTGGKQSSTSGNIVSSPTQQPAENNNNTGSTISVKDNKETNTGNQEIKTNKGANVPATNTMVTTKKSRALAGRSAISTTPGGIAEDNQIAYHKKVTGDKTKGRLKIRQTNPGINEDLPAGKNNETINNNEEKQIEEQIPDSKTGTSNTALVPSIEDNNNTAQIPAADKKDPLPAERTDTSNKQDNKTAEKKGTRQHWYIDAGATPVITSSPGQGNILFNRTIRLPNSTSSYNGQLLKNSIEPAVAFSIAIRRTVTKNLSLGAGLQYLLLKENIHIAGKETNTTFTPVDRLVNGQLVPDTVVTVSEGNRDITAVNSYRVVSIPVFAQYKITGKKSWSLSVTGGVYINFAGSYRNEIDLHADAPLVAAQRRQQNGTGLDLFTGIRFGKSLGRRVEFFAMPSMRWNIKRYNIQNSLFDNHTNQAGAGFGISYTIH